ncbi:P-type conjugative transfer protein TrbG [Mesorhizobium sp. WSM4312]|uniref:P-type conjugative transfer protein TrbG n=1 Tax=unclassified Mesorhizobium TaxID=325217 RepID=UPI000BAE702C|nr:MULTISPECIES: P-type conjugative transfer protein TrbG [unclassified Mesorhizobium]PBB23967.1 P-type conjugative transfer protein TrbG [Mesorhizobium sp. WSM4304]PBB65905.1 P-type conjugative transfer protein TrbG [Mesorhizobium sp. WSM4312]PBB72872.1 P-type conjugative transfer protein TrbG [Mesorhizobium sp. WSM4308]PBC20101.1 P-type conjugative transfer protein TrbG [Mesorhizobium sp. WSM4311]TRC77937.1 P-type conjugative transfer protein TrbG [Mesorhizobium sp. WSM4315]
MSLRLRVVAVPSLRGYLLSTALVSAAAFLAGCAATPTKPPNIRYDPYVPPLAALPKIAREERPRPLLMPPAWAPARGGGAGNTPTARVENANAVARVEPRRKGYYNAIQIYPWSEGALYQVYASPGQITDIALEPGESLAGEGPIAAGDTARWIIGDTESGSGITRRVHVLVKPSRADIKTNLVIATDRRSYMLELRAGAKTYMPAVAWSYPAPRAGSRQAIPTTPVIPDMAARNYRYGLTGDAPPWKPVSVFDDGRKVYVAFPRGIVQGEMPPIFVIGPDGEAEIANSRVYQNILIVDRLFGAAELRLGSGKRQQTVRIVRLDGRAQGRLRQMPSVGRVGTAGAKTGGGEQP